MIEHGAKIKVEDVTGWYDAGKLDTLLETNRTVLEKGRARVPKTAHGGRIVEPVYIEDGVTLTGSTIGPNVSLGTGSVVLNSTIRDSVIGEKATIEKSALQNSLVGDRVTLKNVLGEVTVGDDSEVHGAS
jgi:glucose-1-phosphate thymidylyltransferase